MANAGLVEVCKNKTVRQNIWPDLMTPFFSTRLSNFATKGFFFQFFINTVNDLINAHLQINVSYLIHAPSTLLKLCYTPFSNEHPPSNRRPL